MGNIGNWPFYDIEISYNNCDYINLRNNISLGYYSRSFTVPNNYYQMQINMQYYDAYGRPIIMQHHHHQNNFYNYDYYLKNYPYNKNNFFINNNNRQHFNQQNNENNNIQQVEKYQKLDHLRGLVNIASTCYMNATLQCFAHVKELFAYFQKAHIRQLMNDPRNKEKLFPVFGELINCMWYQYDSSPLYPYIFKERLGKLNPLFQGAIPNDAKDLLTFLLMQLHDELNEPKNNNNNNMNANMIINQQNKRAMLDNFASDFKKNYRSIISNLFYGLTYNQTQCQFCKAIIYNYQTFNFLIFPLAQVLDYKMRKVNYQNNFNNTVTLEDCFEHNQIFNPLNDYYCNICRQTSNGMFATFISVLPNIIIIILNRGTGLQYKVKIDFEENLDLKNYVEFFKDQAFYELIGVVTHYGDSGASGHFMARCKSPIDGFWYLYNDAIIQKLEYFTKENFLQGNPYILFYKKTKFANK